MKISFHGAAQGVPGPCQLQEEEASAMSVFAHKLNSTRVKQPELHQSFTL